MSTTIPASPPVPGFISQATFHRLSVDQYHHMIRQGILTEADPVELLEGYMVTKMPRSPEHGFAISVLPTRLVRLAPAAFTVRGQCAATIQESEPEPDLVVARGKATLFLHRHPGPDDTALVIEVSASSLVRDRNDKGRIYARAGIPAYWVVNVVDKVIEVYTQPSGAAEVPSYLKREDFAVGTTLPVVLDGTEFGSVAVAEVMG